MDFELTDVQDVIKQALLNKPTGDPFIDARYDATTQERQKPLHYYRFFYLFAKRFKPSLSVELGAWQATCAAHIASGNPDGVVVTIDHHTDPGDEVHKVLTLEAAQNYPNLIYLQGWTWDKKGEVEAIGKPIDLLFIDSWHQYEMAMRDWNDYSPMLASPSLVVADDLLTGEGPVIGGMRRFWDGLPGEEKFMDGTLHTTVGGCYPMGFLRHV